MRKKIKKIGALVVLGIFMAMILSPSVSANPDAWDTQGNTISSSDFLGTKNSEDLVFKTNYDSDTSTKMIIKTDGKVGIGLAGPGTKLEVRDTSTQLRLSYDGTDKTDFQTTSSGYLGISPSGGRVGIGTTSPECTLHVAGGVWINGGATIDNGLRVGEWALWVDDPNDRVGIGCIPTQGATLSVNGPIWSGASYGGTILFHGTNIASTPTGDGFRFRNERHFWATDNEAYIFEKTDADNADPDGGIAFVNTGSDGVPETAMVIKGDGNVGIGINGPNDKLEVAGDASADSFKGRPSSNAQFLNNGKTYGVVVEPGGQMFIGRTDTQNFKGILIESGTEKVSIGPSTISHKLTITSIDEKTLRLIGPDDYPTTGYGARLNFGDGDSVYIEEDENDKLYIYSSSRTAIMGGNVGIGTATPSTKLDVNGVITATGGNSDQWNTAYGWGDHSLAGYITSESDPQVGANTLNYVPKWDGSALIKGTIYDNGNIGIGTNNPGAKLEIVGDLKVDSGTLYIDDYDNEVGIGTTNPLAELDVRGSAIINCDKEANYFNVKGTNDDWLIMTQPNFNRVGIGTNSPSAKLTVEGDLRVDSFFYVDDTNDAVGIKTVNPTATLDVRGSAIFNFGLADNDFKICGDNDLNLFNVDAYNDRIGIGALSPCGKLDIDGSLYVGNEGIYDRDDGIVNVKEDLIVEGGDIIGANSESITLGSTNDVIAFISGGAERMRIYSNGNVGIGTTTPLNTLDVRTSQEYAIYGLSSDTTHGRAGIYGESQASSGGGWHIGIKGKAIGSNTGQNIGVYGAASGATYNYAGYFDGDVYIDGRLGIGYTQASLGTAKLAVNGPALINGNLAVNGVVRADIAEIDLAIFAVTKAFRINHTLNDSKYLVHGALEGPEWGVIYRGNGTLYNGQATIYLPYYYDSLTLNNSYTVQLTAKGSTPFTLSYDSFNETAFKVYGSVQTGEFDWEVKATRDDVDPLEVEPDKDPE